ncbi:hypothetical protein CVT24_009285 [Panaeolus cyanescens]|uniref:Uncharacterized protein n=1 Tax=Panaeolus cyanescens TaxID=181874 RepID=A0A409Y859_9AGAR|nr:hypothetical protein CVT24_009285 [Panaeolus cyanescens]
MEDYDDPDRATVKRAKDLLKLSLGPSYSVDDRTRNGVFQHISDNIRFMCAEKIRIDGLTPMPRNAPGTFVVLSPDKSEILLTRSFFEDPSVEDDLRVHILLHEIFRQKVPALRSTSMFALPNPSGPNRMLLARPLFPGDMVLPGETAVDTTRVENLKAIMASNGAKVLPFSPDLIPFMGYIVTHNGALPPSGG